MKEKDIRRALHAIKLAESVDIAFIIDCTGSMGSYIESVKNSIRQIVDRVVSTNCDMKLRLAIVGYRDIRDTSRFEIMDFSPSVNDFKTFLASICATGGDDAPEDMAGAIKEANELAWENPTKIAFIIADAPCHGREFHGYDDSYPDGSPGINIIDELKALEEKAGPQGTMNVTFGRITDQTDTMIARFQENKVSIDQVGIEESSKLTKTVTASVRKSIFKTVTCIGKPGASVSFAPIDGIEEVLKGDRALSRKSDASLKDYTISPSVPTSIDWTKQPFSRVKVYRNVRIKKVSDLQEPIKMGLLRFVSSAVAGKASMSPTDKTFESSMLIRRAPSPFAEGEIRLAYHGQLAQKEKDLGKVEHGMVFKSFKHLGKRVHDRGQYLKQMEVSAIADFLARAYNESPSKPAHCCNVSVLPVIVVEEEDEKNETTGNRRFCVEQHLPKGGTEFVKYSNNTGYWDEDVLDETLLRFTKFTHDITHGYILVSDLQGVRRGSSYYLTDPVILCKDILRFGNTNLGEKFVKKCIDSTNAHLKEHKWG